MTKPVHIYVLEDPQTNEVRYVGKTIQRLSTRLAFHVYTAKKAHNHKQCWIKGLLNKGKRPNIRLVEDATLENWQEKEMFYIGLYRKLGMNLTNLSIGGDGSNGFNHRDETKKIIGVKSKLRVYTDEYRKKLATGKVGMLNPQCKLSDVDLLNIYSLIDQGAKQRHIAKVFGVDQSHISRIASGKYKEQCKFDTRFRED